MNRIRKAAAATAAAAALTLALTLQMHAAGRRARPAPPPAAVALETELPDGAAVSAFDADGLLASSAVVRGGKGVLTLAPGDYTLRGGDLSLRFTLHGNAAVGAAEGDGWADGEVLHLSAQQGFSVTLYRTGGSACYRYTLSGAAGDYAAVLDYTAGSMASHWRSTRIPGVPAGEYRLYENGRFLRLVEVTGGVALCVDG